jgi:hypothetical protein
MSKKLVAFTVALVATMTVGVLALTAGSPAAAGCLIQTCAQCPDVIIHENGLICENPVCRVQSGCPRCNYTCHF